MDVTKLFLACTLAFLTLNKPCEGKLTGENIEEEFIKLKSRVEKLEETTLKQSDQLSVLQETVSMLQRKTERQSRFITYLQKKTLGYRRVILKQKTALWDPENKEFRQRHGSKMANGTHLNYSFKVPAKSGRYNFLKQKTMKSNGNFITRKERLLIPLTTLTPSYDSVAFYAYMSSWVSDIGPNHVLVFDVVKTNSGNGYHQNTGVFIAPKSGLYVFYWNIRVYNEISISVQLVVNKEVQGVLFQHSTTSHNSQAGNLAIVHVNQGDDVFLRTNPNDQHYVGEIVNDWHGRSSFSGWSL